MGFKSFSCFEGWKRSGILLSYNLPLFIRQGFKVLFPPRTPPDMPFPEFSEKRTGIVVVFFPELALLATGHDSPP
jgi:hypothetical protein